MTQEIITKGLELLFDRPNETLITPKGENYDVYQLTEQFLPKGYEKIGIEINNRFSKSGGDTIIFKNLPKPPQFPKASQLPLDADFSLFLPKHQEMVTEVIDVLMGVPENNLPEFLSTCVYARVNLSAQLFNYCFTVALIHRNDTKNIRIQNFAETFPSKFLHSQVFAKAREIVAVMQKGTKRPKIIIPKATATDLDIEHRLAYFREDIGVNLHHWHWHLVYPFTSNRQIVAKDRRGELFYYMHQQIMARYNGERLNNELHRTKRFSNWREPIPGAYFPKLDSLTSSRAWPPRQANMRWQNLYRHVDGLNLTISKMERWRKNLEEAIATGLVRLPNGKTQELDIDMLGNMVESTILSPNRELYGSLHNNGHNFAAYMHDPEHLYLESFSVLGDGATTMRDPFFYRWHAFIDDLFQRYKETKNVPAYKRSELENPGVYVTSATIESDGGQANTLNTFWMTSDVDVSRGLDFSDRGSVFVRYTHLNHRPFRYVINVDNGSNAGRATVRIFMAPKFNERNQAWVLNEQRKMFIEMDRFVVQLKPGENRIVRQSSESSVTIPFEQTFRDLRAGGGDPKRGDQVSSSYCSCGWPQHMLVPRGTEMGAAYQLFIMLSNYELDKVEQPDGREMTCKEASSFCGLKDKLYPDKRSMGFPFDRPDRTVTRIEKFILPNMALVDITIRLQNDTDPEPNPYNPTG